MMKKHHPPITRCDETYEYGKEFGTISCPKCDCRVVYGVHGKTRPKYCPLCEKSEFEKVRQSEYFKRLTAEQRDHYIMLELRSPAPPPTHKTIQQLVEEVL